jgi:hypothetical protein
MAKQTTSDQLKQIFEKHSLGKVADWKRLSKENQPGVGVVRIFENKVSGAKLKVTETGPGLFDIQPLTLQKTFTAEVKDAPYTPPAPLTLDSFIEKDPAKNKAADELITLHYGDDVTDRETANALDAEIKQRYNLDPNDYHQRDEIYDDLAEKAGTRAINNRYLFGFEQQDDGYYIWTSPVKFFEKKGHTSDQTGWVSPGYSEAMESCFEVYGDDLETAVEKVLKRGLQWNEEYQRNVCDNQDQQKELIDKINAVVNKFRGGTPAPTAPEAPKPGM